MTASLSTSLAYQILYVIEKIEQVMVAGWYSMLDGTFHSIEGVI